MCSVCSEAAGCSVFILSLPTWHKQQFFNSRRSAHHGSSVMWHCNPGSKQAIFTSCSGFCIGSLHAILWICVHFICQWPRWSHEMYLFVTCQPIMMLLRSQCLNWDVTGEGGSIIHSFLIRICLKKESCEWDHCEYNSENHKCVMISGS